MDQLKKNSIFGSESFSLNLSKLESAVSKYWIAFYLIYIGMVLITAWSAWWLLLQWSAHIIGKSTAVFLLPLVIVDFLLFCLFFRAFKKNPEKIFLILCAPVLSLFALFIIPDQVPDEIWHIFKVFDLRISGSEMVVPSIIDRTSYEFPTTYPALYNAVILPADWGDTSTVYREFSTYFPHMYFIPSLFASLCEVLNVNPYITIFIARLSNAAMFSIAGYWIIKWIPLGKVVVLIYLLNPMFVQQEASLSPDAFVNAISLMFIAYCIRLRFKDSILPFQWVALVILACLMSISKFAYAPFLLLFLMFVPRLSNRKIRVSIYAITGFVICVVGIYVLVAYQGETYYESLVLVRDFPEFVSVMWKSIYELGPLWIKEFAGLILGALNISVWEPCFWAYSGILLFSIVFNLGNELSFKRAEKVCICVLVVFVTIALILVFREWTLEVDQRSDVIMGVQGRYFIPYFILPLLCAITPRSSLRRDNCLVFYSSILGIVYLIDIFMIIFSFV